MNFTTYDLKERELAKMHMSDRIIVLQPMEGKTPLSSTGNVDKRIFSGENNLHGILKTDTGLWEFWYEKGSLPGALECKFTTFAGLLDYAKEYFAKRNVEVKEVIG